MYDNCRGINLYTPWVLHPRGVRPITLRVATLPCEMTDTFYRLTAGFFCARSVRRGEGSIRAAGELALIAAIDWHVAATMVCRLFSRTDHGTKAQSRWSESVRRRGSSVPGRATPVVMEIGTASHGRPME